MNYSIKALTLPLLFAPALAAAHSGDAAVHGSSQFLAGIVHAMTGFDHMLGAIMGGMCAALAVNKGNKALVSALPLLLFGAVAFLISAVLGSLMPASLANMAEWAVLCSLLVMVVAIAAGLKQRGQPLALAALLITALASCHALAHGAEYAAVPLAEVVSFALGACTLLVVVASLSSLACKRLSSRFNFAKY